MKIKRALIALLLVACLLGGCAQIKSVLGMEDEEEETRPRKTVTETTTTTAVPEETTVASGEEITEPAPEETTAAEGEGEGETEIPTVTTVAQIWKANEEASCTLESDVNRDNVNEQIVLSYSEEEKKAILSVEGITADIECVRIANFAIVDMNGVDKFLEMLVTVDVASDDFMTYAYRYKDGILLTAEAISGTPTTCVDGVLTVEDTVDILGSWKGTTQYLLSNGTGFALVRPTGAYWVLSNTTELTLKQELDVAIASESATDGFVSKTLKKGAALTLTATDASSYVAFSTSNGSTGYFAISVDENGKVFVGELADSKVFSALPYAG